MERQYRAGILLITEKDFKKAFDLPDEASILKASCSFFSEGRALNLVVESPNLAPVHEGTVLPIVSLSRISGYDE